MVAGVEDSNGDGFDDFVQAGYGYDNGTSSTGRLYLYYGSASAFSGTYDSSSAADVTIDGTGFYDYLGYSITGSIAHGDLNGDGFDELIAGGYYYDQTWVFDVYGATSSGNIDTDDADVLIEGNSSGDLGYAVASAGDLDGDGYDDLVLGERNYGNGYVYVPGHDVAGDGDLRRDSAAGITIEGEASGDDFGSAVRVADVNGDGNPDLIAGAHYFDGDAGTTTGALYGMYGPLSAGSYAASSADFESKARRPTTRSAEASSPLATSPATGSTISPPPSTTRRTPTRWRLPLCRRRRGGRGGPRAPPSRSSVQRAVRTGAQPFDGRGRGGLSARQTPGGSPTRAPWPTPRRRPALRRADLGDGPGPSRRMVRRCSGRRAPSVGEAGLPSTYRSVPAGGRGPWRPTGPKRRGSRRRRCPRSPRGGVVPGVPHHPPTAG